MITHYFKIALRNIAKFKTYSMINVLGLVIGFTCFLLISLFILNELNYDRYHLKGDRIYRLALGSIAEDKMVTGISAAAMPFTLKNEFAGIEEVVRIKHLPSLVAYENQPVFEERLFFADSTFFKVFSNHLMLGDPDKALVNSFSIVLTESSARRYFGEIDTNIIGKLLKVDESMTFMVTGVVEDPPDNSHLHFDMLASLASLPYHPQENVGTYQLNSWYSHYYYNYILLNEGVDSHAVDRNIRDAAKKYSDPVYYERFGKNMGLFLQPLYDIHLNPLRGELEEQGDPIMLSILGGVALVIMLLGSINYMNISTAQSTHRIVEVGIRKTMGASRRQMALQFLGESTVINLIALFLSIGVVDLVLPVFNLFAAKDISLFSINGQTIILVIGIVLATGIMGGLYPALFLGSHSPVKSLKKNPGSISGKLGLRRAIVVFQFVVSIVLVGGTFLIFSQVKYMLGKDLGLNAEGVIVIPTRGDPLVNGRVSSLFERLSNRSEVLNYSISELSPGDQIYGIVASFEGRETLNYSTTGIDYGYLDTYKIPLVAGRNFSRDNPLDTIERVIINESLAKSFGWTAHEAIGKRYDQEGDGVIVGEVIGVAQDFNFGSLREEIRPMVMGLMPYFYRKISVRIAGDFNNTIDIVEKAWKETYPTRPFEFRFADETIQRLYHREKKFGTLFMFFALVASSIGLLGLFGISSLQLKFRTKEIGIRKVLGAPLGKLLLTLSGDFIVLTSLAFIISVPLAYYLMTQWLQNFTYRIDSIIHFIVWPGLLVIVMAMVVVLIKTLYAASANSVDALRSE